MKTDIEIAQEAVMESIGKVAEKIGIGEDDLELYGKYKAKLSNELIKRVEERPDGKLVLMTAINPTPAGEGKTTTSIGLAQAFCKMGKKAILALREPSLRTVLWYQRWCGWRRIFPGGTDGRSEPAFHRRFSCHHIC